MTDVFNRFEMKERRQELRREMTEAERLLWARIRSRQINGCKFRRQYSIGSYVVDFYSTEIKLAIEIDRSSHDKADAIEYDRNRQKEIEALGICVVRFTNEEIYNKLNDVLVKINETIKSRRQSFMTALHYAAVQKEKNLVGQTFLFVIIC
ncbi:MAG: endonuclease domain-containing protein [bacterium]